jgi:hypothetical protein
MQGLNMSNSPSKHEGKPEAPPADLSLKYIAWNVKKMDESLAIIAKALTMLIEEKNREPRRFPDEDGLPF